jgi:hypothetical protein
MGEARCNEDSLHHYLGQVSRRRCYLIKNLKEIREFSLEVVLYLGKKKHPVAFSFA